MRVSVLLTLLALFLGASSSAFADTYQYEYSVNIPGFWVADIVVDSSVLITTATSFAPGDFISCVSNVGGCSEDLNFLTVPQGAGVGSVQNGFEGTVPLSAIESVGSYTNGFETLTVTETPEPSSIALLGTGILGFAGLARRRFFSA